MVLLSYPTRRSRPVLVDGKQRDGAPLPFGAEVYDLEDGEVIGSVGQGSRIVMRVRKDEGRVSVRWGSKADQRCRIDYALSERARPERLRCGRERLPAGAGITRRPDAGGGAEAMIGRRILALRHAGLAGMAIVAAWIRLAGAARADMSVDGTRFVYPAREKAISVYVGNIGGEPILVQSWLDRGEARDANDLARLRVPFVLTPPLLRLEPNERKAVQLRYTGESLPRIASPCSG